MRTAAVINSLLDAADPLVIESRASLVACSAVSVSSPNMCATETLICPRLSYAPPPKAQFVPNESCADLHKLVSRCFDICFVTCRKPCLAWSFIPRGTWQLSLRHYLLATGVLIDQHFFPMNLNMKSNHLFFRLCSVFYPPKHELQDNSIGIHWLSHS